MWPNDDLKESNCLSNGSRKHVIMPLGMSRWKNQEHKTECTGTREISFHSYKHVDWPINSLIYCLMWPEPIKNCHFLWLGKILYLYCSVTMCQCTCYSLAMLKVAMTLEHYGWQQWISRLHSDNKPIYVSIMYNSSELATFLLRIGYPHLLGAQDHGSARITCAGVGQ